MPIFYSRLALLAGILRTLRGTWLCYTFYAGF